MLCVDWTAIIHFFLLIFLLKIACQLIHLDDALCLEDLKYQIIADPTFHRSLLAINMKTIIRTITIIITEKFYNRSKSKS